MSTPHLPSKTAAKSRAPSLKRKASSSAIALMTAVVIGGGLAATGAINSGFAEQSAQPAATETQILTPATFSSLAAKVKPAVVSVRVSGKAGGTRGSESGEPSIPETLPRGPNGAPFDEFLKRFFDERQFGERRGQRGEQRRGDRQPRRGPRSGNSVGSGFIVSADGFVVTNNHVIDSGGDIVVVMDDGTEIDAKLIGTDDRTDLAVLKIEGKDLPHVKWTNDAPTVGEWVMAVGNPFGLGGTVTTGIISASGRAIGSGPYDDFLQIDAAVNRGNSGGPTFNLDGEVVGVNTAIFSPNGGSVGIGFAISAKLASTVVADLMDDGDITRGWLGVSIQDVDKQIAESLGLDGPGGALVSNLTKDGPAAKAGLKTGDVVLSVDDDEIEGTRDLARTIASIQPGTNSTVSVWRRGKMTEIDVSIGTLPGQKKLASMQRGETPDAKPEPASFSALGLELETFDGEDGDKGIIVAKVEAGSDAESKGVRVGDRILSVSGQAVANISDLESAIELAEAEGLPSVLILVKTNDRQRFVSVKRDKA